MSITIRPLRLPDDYEAIARLVNTYWSEPTDAARLEEDDGKLYAVGHTFKDENGFLGGYDRLRQVAVTELDEVIGYLWIWRAPWTEPGNLNYTMVVDPTFRNQGAGKLLYEQAVKWAHSLGASQIMTDVWDDDAAALDFARNRGFVVDRHAFQSVLSLEGIDPTAMYGADACERLRHEGIRFTTLAEEGADEGEPMLYELYKETLVDIPGYSGEVPAIAEWRQWYLMANGYAPDQVLIAADGDRYVGVTNVLYNTQTNGMYHEYTGVSRDYRRRSIGLALKVIAIELAAARKAAYIRTDNDSTNAPILTINRKLGYKPLRGSYRMVVSLRNSSIQ
ncbi:GNAT family N-acetyltransferase [Paenibacillus mendelii]|uniref:GNAT family N-acetyltransferase n=1 Tax=Paenibacillus mendelii TaxID=206163 RepID=A0ABV6JFE9_9BACL|nr:GNAT family N-acetyltransferase [Paenibacillus mendelii]MCQ6557141.1 GNAT family N-acetyltransferase [Paenibacillus mendelii]